MTTMMNDDDDAVLDVGSNTAKSLSLTIAIPTIVLMTNEDWFFK